jgi:phenylalanine-4-hydroxylase
MDNISYVRTTGETQIAWKGEQLIGHGIDFHTAGFGSPVGHVNEFSRCLSEYSIDELRFAGIQAGTRATLEFVSGVVVEGDLLSIERRDQKNILLSFNNCRVTGIAGEILFDPSWGQYDMAVGTGITSVFGGSADASEFPLYNPPAEKTSTRSWSESDQSIFKIYQGIRKLRQSGKAGDKSIQKLQHSIESQQPDEWLLLFEFYELLWKKDTKKADLILAQLNNLVGDDETVSQLVHQGIERIQASL